LAWHREEDICYCSARKRETGDSRPGGKAPKPSSSSAEDAGQRFLPEELKGLEHLFGLLFQTALPAVSILPRGSSLVQER